MITISPGERLGCEHLLDIGPEDDAVHGLVDDTGRGDGALAQPSHEGGGFPVPVWHRGDQPLAPPGTAMAPGHGCVGAGLVDENQPGRIEACLPATPELTRGGHVGACLLSRVRGFF